MKPHAPYTEPDWQREMAQSVGGASLACPDCGSASRYRPYGYRRSDGSERHYRACKACGFWQEADGSQPYRVWLPLHNCAVQLRPDQIVFNCPVCGRTFVSPKPGAVFTHVCGKYLTPWESGYTCPTCRKHLDRASAVPFPLAGRG